MGAGCTSVCFCVCVFVRFRVAGCGLVLSVAVVFWFGVEALLEYWLVMDMQITFLLIGIPFM